VLVAVRDRAAWPLTALALVLAALTIDLGIANGDVDAGPDATGWLRLALSAAVIALPAGLLAARRPANPIGWLMLAASLLLAMSGALVQYAVYALAVHPGLPGAVGALVASRLTAAIDVVVPLFPTGRLLSRRWLPVALVPAAGGLALVVLGLVAPIPLLDGAPPGPLDGLRDPLAVAMSRATVDTLITVANGVTVLALPFALASLVIRYRRAAGVERAQLRWFAYASAALVIVLILDPYFGDPLATVVGVAAAALLPLAIVVAILRYRLYDIDLIINQTLVYGALSAGVALLYVGVVVGFGALVQARSSLALSLLATGLIAAGFTPARNRLQRVVDRWVHRDQPDPYRVLAEVGQRLASATVADEVLPGLAATVAQALRLPYAAVETAGTDGGTTLATYGEPTDARSEVPLTYQGRRVGTLVVGRDPLSASEQELLADLGRQAGAAVHAVALTADLARSRERLVVAREEERRRLRRDLHDGLGPTLAAIGMRADAAGRALAQEPAAARQALADIKGDAQLAFTEVRRLVQDLRPPVLDERGLVAAVRAGADRYRPGLAVTVQAPDDLGDLPAGVEVAAYRIIGEALANVVKHADARTAQVRLTRTTRALELEVSDDGAGLDASRVGSGAGMSTMAERAEELGGRCSVTTGPTGTRVHAVLPLGVS
jgi:signal transduction histidine kinase